VGISNQQSKPGATVQPTKEYAPLPPDDFQTTFPLYKQLKDFNLFRDCFESDNCKPPHQQNIPTSPAQKCQTSSDKMRCNAEKQDFRAEGIKSPFRNFSPTKFRKSISMMVSTER
jgi:hypothetical protein